MRAYIIVVSGLRFPIAVLDKPVKPQIRVDDVVEVVELNIDEDTYEDGDVIGQWSSKSLNKTFSLIVFNVRSCGWNIVKGD